MYICIYVRRSHIYNIHIHVWHIVIHVYMSYLYIWICITCLYVTCLYVTYVYPYGPHICRYYMNVGITCIHAISMRELHYPQVWGSEARLWRLVYMHVGNICTYIHIHMSYRYTYHVFMSYPCMCVSFTYEYLYWWHCVSVCRSHLYISIYEIGRGGHQISAVYIYHICVVHITCTPISETQFHSCIHI